MSDRKFILENFAFRTASHHPDRSVNIGNGNAYAKLMVIHHDHIIPERDGTSGALKRFDLLDEVYRVPHQIVDGLDLKSNRLLLKELIEIIRPLLIVTSGHDATELLLDESIGSFKAYSGREFQVADLTSTRFYAILNPEEYSFARAPTQLKERGKTEWETLVAEFNKLRRQQEVKRWKA